MTQVVYSSKSRLDIRGIAAHIAVDNPVAARRVLDAIEYTIDLLREFPGLGGSYPHPSHPELRAKLVSGFGNYIIFYTATAEQVYIVRVLHGSRDIPNVLGE